MIYEALSENDANSSFRFGIQLLGVGEEPGFFLTPQKPTARALSELQEETPVALLPFS